MCPWPPLSFALNRPIKAHERLGPRPNGKSEPAEGTVDEPILSVLAQIRVERGWRWSMCTGVNRWKAILSVLCLAMWLPATQHCNLENVPGLGFLRCAGDTAEKSNCNGDSCDTVEKGSYRPSDNTRVGPAPILLALVVSLHLQSESLRSQDANPGAVTFPPPDLPRGWQFITRSAAPPRAPSFAS